MVHHPWVLFPCPTGCCWGCQGSRAHASSVHCGSCSWCFLMPLLVHGGSERAAESLQFWSPKLRGYKLLGSSPMVCWRADGWWTDSLQPGASGVGHGDSSTWGLLVWKTLLAICGSFCTNKTTCTHPGRNWCCVWPSWFPTANREQRRSGGQDSKPQEPWCWDPSSPGTVARDFAPSLSYLESGVKNAPGSEMAPAWCDAFLKGKLPKWLLPNRQGLILQWRQRNHWWEAFKQRGLLCWPSNSMPLNIC